MDTDTTFPRRGIRYVVSRMMTLTTLKIIWRCGITAAYRSSCYDRALLNTIGDAFAAHEAKEGLVLIALIGTEDFRRMYMSPTIRKAWDLSFPAGASMFVKKTDTVKQTSVGRLWMAELFVRDGMDGRIVLSS